MGRFPPKEVPQSIVLLTPTIEGTSREFDERVILITVLWVHFPFPWHTCNLVMPPRRFRVVKLAGLVVVRVINAGRVSEAARKAM